MKPYTQRFLAILLIGTLFLIGAVVVGRFIIKQDGSSAMNSPRENTPSETPDQVATSVPPAQMEEFALFDNSTTTELIEYTDDFLGIRFSYPSEKGIFFDAGNRRCAAVAPVQTSEREERTTTNLCVVPYVNASNTPLEIFIEEHLFISDSGFMRSEESILSLGDYPAILIRSERDVERAYDTGPSVRHDLVIQGERNIVYHIFGTQIPLVIAETLSFYTPTITVPPYALNIAWTEKRIEIPEDKVAIELRSCTEGKSYQVGVVTNGFFKGDKLIARNREYCDMNCGGRAENELNYYVYHAGREIRVGPGTPHPVTGLDLPQQIPISNSSYVLRKDFASNFFEDSGEVTSLFVDTQAGAVYEEGSRRKCLITERKDHARVYYSLDVPFINKENGQVDLTLLDGKKFDESYDYGSDWSCLPVVDRPDGLLPVARNSLGEFLYALDPEDKKLKTLFADKNTMASYQKLDLTYEQFLAIHPFLYWKDPLGRWIELKNKKYLLAAEKCKPVIYLYPERTMDMSVYVKPNAGFTHTIPEYHEGWHVTASPSGTIIDKATRALYPYLYWAGWSTDIPSITEGWVVGLGDVDGFLKEKLAYLGLNEKEIADFNEYWVARLRDDGAPYYKIMFLEREEIDRLAPLKISAEERPETVIRVIMYAQASNGNVVLPEQKLLPKPVRDGFTVVEWGGSLLK